MPGRFFGAVTRGLRSLLRPTRVHAAGALVAILLGQSATPEPTPEPVFEIHRTASGAHRPSGDRPLFILVIGSDTREGDPVEGRADSLHVVAVDPRSGAGTIIGIPRDSYVNVPGLGRSKITNALRRRGPETVVATVEALSGLKMDYWALIEFSRFRQLVDRVGGIEVDIPYRFADSLSGAYFDPGPRLLNGAEALAFSRARHGVPNGDFGRSENQGRVLLAALGKLRHEAQDPFALPKYFAAFDDLVSANVSLRELLDLTLIARSLDPSQITNVVLPGRPTSAGGASIVQLLPGANAMFEAVKDDARL